MALNVTPTPPYQNNLTQPGGSPPAIVIDVEELFKKVILAYGEYSVQNTFKRFHLDCTTPSTKILDLFLCVIADQGLNTVTPTYEVSQLKNFMEPYLLAESRERLWAAILRTAPLPLKMQMWQTKLSVDPLEKGNDIRQFLETHQAELKSIKELNLKNCQIRVLPPEIKYFSGIQLLDISENKLKELPLELFSLKQLTKFYAANNCLSSIPPQIAALNLLQFLILDQNKLEQLPDEMGCLKNLKLLNLSRNSLIQLPDSICALKSLIYLYLAQNQLDSLPESLGELPQLVALHLCNNSISFLPASLGRSPYLQYLSIPFNNLKELPENIGELKSLRTLFVNNNSLTNLPESVCNLQNLTHLSIYENPLTSLPEKLGDLSKLKFFSCGMHQMDLLPDGIERLPYWSKFQELYPQPLMQGDHFCLNLSLIGFDERYFKLGAKKWMECIDGNYHHHGADVFDLGLHGGTVEAGFLGSMQNAFQFLADHPNQIIDAKFYLELHKVTCSHFLGADNGTLMGQEKVGVFRGLDDPIYATFKAPNYEVGKGGIAEFQQLNETISLIFGPTFKFGEMHLISENPLEISIKYNPIDRHQVEMIVNFFLTEFYYEIGHAENPEMRLTAIAKLIQHLEWLHPPRDGCGRTDTALLNFLLTCYGFTPVLLQFPYVSSCKSLREWVYALKAGMQAWEMECAKQ